MARNKYPEETVQRITDQAMLLFTEKGYESTSIQDIINRLGGLSKGAIYHHFRSKEEIFEAVCEKIGEQNILYYDAIRDDPNKNGFEKLRTILCSAYENPTNDAVIAMMSGFLSDPKFFKKHIEEIYELIAPKYIQPVIEQGILDGSIKTGYPKELAEVLITLLNVWINPVIAKSTPEHLLGKIAFFSLLLKKLDLDLFDQEIIDQYVTLCRRYDA